MTQPGVRAILEGIRSTGAELSPAQFVDSCLEYLGQYEIGDKTRQSLVSHAERDGDLVFDRRGAAECSEQRITEMLQLVVATREYQLA